MGVVWGVVDRDGKFVELAGGDGALGGGKEFGVFDDKGDKDIGVLDDRDNEMGAFDCDGESEETGLFNDEGVEEVRMSDNGGKNTGVFDDKDEVGVSDDGGGEVAGVFDEAGAEEVGAFDERGGKEIGLLDGRVPDEDANEVGDWGCEDDIEGGTSVDAGGTIHWPRRSTPRGHVVVGEEEVEGDEGGRDGGGNDG